jgi:hypothetical protein
MDDFVSARILAALLANLPVPFRAKPVDPGLHPGQQLFRRTGGDPCPLKLADFTALPSHLAAHVLDFISELIESWHGSP